MFFREQERIVYTRDIMLPNTRFFKCNFLDDDFKVGGVQVSTSFYVKVPRLQFVGYSCPFSFKTRNESIADTKGKMLTDCNIKKIV